MMMILMMMYSKRCREGSVAELSEDFETHNMGLRTAGLSDRRPKNLAVNSRHTNKKSILILSYH